MLQILNVFVSLACKNDEQCETGVCNTDNKCGNFIIIVFFNFCLEKQNEIVRYSHMKGSVIIKSNILC